MIETRRLNNVVIFYQTILSFALSSKIINISKALFLRSKKDSDSCILANTVL